MYGELEVRLNCILNLGTRCESRASRCVPFDSQKEPLPPLPPSTQWTEGWLVIWKALGAVLKREIYLCWEANPSSSVIQPVAWSLYRLPQLTQNDSFRKRVFKMLGRSWYLQNCVDVKFVHLPVLLPETRLVHHSVSQPSRSVVIYFSFQLLSSVISQFSSYFGL
jgi:hypothetical protein